MSKSVAFKPRARLMSQLGDQLIKDENIAVLELIKNSYDADAKNVRISFENLDNQKSTIITIEDNGDGMSLDTVINYWMEPGTDNKEKKLKQMIEKDQRSALNRLPMGEKGIGRFGVHKLGNKITIITHAEGQKEVFLEIDWTIFNSGRYLSDIPIRITDREPQHTYLGKTKGTKIIIEKLKTEWTRGKIRELYRSINSLNSPFKSLESFEIEFVIDKAKKDWLDGLLGFEDIKDYVLFKATMTLSGDKIIGYQYNFLPWKSMTKLASTEKKLSEIQIFNEQYIETEKGKKRKELIPMDLNKYQIGEVKIELLSFDLDSKTLSMGVRDIKGFKDYMKKNGGIYVYRDNIRIYENGENDWLGLGLQRVNAPGDKISNNLVLGCVNIDRKCSSDLREKTNREGFIEDDAYIVFKDAIAFAVEKFEHDRAMDKQLLRKYYGVSSKTEPVISEVSLLRGKVEKKINDRNLKKEILGCLDNIEKDYKHIAQVYQASSSMGLSMSVVLHEIDKIISELKHVMNSENSSLHIKALVNRLGSLTDGYAAVLKSKTIKAFDIVKMIDQSLFMVDFRLQAHDITVEKQYLNDGITSRLKGNENLISSSIINIIDNSIWWLHYAKVPLKKIYFGITRQIPGYLSIIIADNGKGFTISSEMAVKPFITDKPGGTGLGLHLASELMRQHGGQLLFPEFDDLQLPSEYREGAIIALAFKEEKN